MEQQNKTKQIEPKNKYRNNIRSSHSIREKERESAQTEKTMNLLQWKTERNKTEQRK